MKHMKVQLKESREDVTLTTYFLDDSMELLKGGKRPVVLVCPGGAYLNCSDREAEPIALAFNNLGYHAAVLRYSVLNQDVVKYMKDPEAVKKIDFDKSNVHPAPIRDIGRAMLWLEKHKEEYFLDTDKIILCGFSAGGHNVLLYGTSWHRPVIGEYFGEDKEKFKPAAVIAGYPLSDYVYMKEKYDEMDLMGKGLFNLSCRSFLGKTEASQEELEAVSPSRLVTDKTPPMFLWATMEDSLVPVQHTLFMARSLANVGIPFESHIFEKGGHGLSLATHATAGAKSEIMPDVASWIGNIDKWLQKRFTLDLPEKHLWEM